MADTPYLSEIKIFPLNYAPKTWAMCNGQFLPINQNQALFSLLGTTYGGNGQTTFALPDLRGRVPIHMGQNFVLGQNGGEESHTLINSEMPQHTHLVTASGNAPNSNLPTGNFFASNTGFKPYFTGNPNVTMNPAGVGSTGGTQPHTNMSPFLVLTFCIALQGIFPSRN
jgi:microcystin-dependent protein